MSNIKISKEYLDSKLISPYEIHPDMYLFRVYKFYKKFKLCAIVKKSGKQILKIFFINKEGKEISTQLNCIHTAVTKIPIEKFKEKINETLKRETLNLRTTENLRKIDLCLEEKFIAFRSWVAGIAEFGLESFKIEMDIEKYSQLLYPIALKLMKFIAMHDQDFLYDYIFTIQREAMHNGVRSDSYLISNLLPICHLLWKFNKKTRKSFINIIMEINPPKSLFTKDRVIYDLLPKSMRSKGSEFYLPKHILNKMPSSCPVLI
jgi:hypothetical protein